MLYLSCDRSHQCGQPASSKFTDTKNARVLNSDIIIDYVYIMLELHTENVVGGRMRFSKSLVGGHLTYLFNYQCICVLLWTS